MTLKQLEAFLLSAQLGSFALAAQRLHVTQSSLSKRISELEAALGRQLFDRSGQRAAVTEAGTLLLPFAEQMVQLEARAYEALSADDTLRGTCRFGVSELVASTWLPRLVARVNAQHPQLVLEPHVDLTRGLERRVERGELDFAVIPGPSSVTALSWTEIARLEYAWMAAPSRLPAGTLLGAEHFLQHPVVTLSAESTLTQSFNRWAAECHFDIPRALVCNSLAALIGLTVAGVGISVFPRVFVRSLLRSGRLVELDSAMPLPDLRYCFQWRRDDSRRMVGLLQQMVQESVDFSIPSAMQALPPDA